MKFETPLIKATLIKRYKRFLADVTLEDGSIVTAHVANPGSMMGLAGVGATVWLEQNDDSKRKLKYSWKLIQLENTFVGLDTSAANKIVKEALEKDVFGFGYANFKPEVKYGEGSRVDFLLTEDGKPDLYLEVKSVTLSREKSIAEFPDSVTARGTKHLAELANMIRAGHRAVMLYVIQRSDAKSFRIAQDIDPKYGDAMQTAMRDGVEVICYDTKIGNTEIVLNDKVDLDFNVVSD